MYLRWSSFIISLPVLPFKQLFFKSRLVILEKGEEKNVNNEKPLKQI